MEITLDGQLYRMANSMLSKDDIIQIINLRMQESADLFISESNELCILCFRRQEKTVTRYCANDYDKGRLLYARQYLLEQVAMPPSIAELSRISGINSFKLKNGFKELFGETVYGYLNKYRLEKAKIFIEEGEKNMTQIAFELGFSSLQHFSTAFKKAYGCSPKKIKTAEKQQP